MNTRYLTRRAALAAAGVGLASLIGYRHAQEEATPDPAHVVQMVTNVGGVHDQGYCEQAWAGLERLREELNYHVSYIESKLESDYATNLDKAVDFGAEFVWGIGYSTADAISFATRVNRDLDVGFGIIDASSNNLPGLTGVLFAAEEPSFVVGYIAGRTTQTSHVGFVGGMSSDTIYPFDFGYRAGVAYAARELGTEIQIDTQYAEAFHDSAKGKSIAQKMYAHGADVIFHAAGATGTGVIEAAHEEGAYAIGVDMDQSYLSPSAVLTSALKRVDQAIFDLTPRLISGELAGGTDVTLHLADGDYLGIPEEHDLMPEGVYEDALQVIELIRQGEVVPPASQDSYDAFMASL